MKSLLLITVVYHCVAFVRGDFVQNMKVDRNEKKGENVEFKNCGERKSPIQLTSLYIWPQPISLRSGVNLLFISAVLNVTELIGVPRQRVSGDLSLKIKYGIKYMELCPLLKYGTCHIDDFCQWLSQQDQMICNYAEKYIGLNCSCPVLPKEYVITTLIPLPRVDLDVHGAFELLVALKDDVSVLGCAEMKLCVNSC